MSPAQRTGGRSVDTWSGWYWLAREEMAFRYGLRRVPVDAYKTQWALGLSPQQACRVIYDAYQQNGGRH